MSSQRRDWAFYVQLLGVLGMWAFALSVNGWFIWRGFDLERWNDAWRPVLLVGGIVGPLFIVFASTLTYLFIKIPLNQEGETVPMVIGPVEEKITDGVLKPWGWRFRVAIILLAGITGWAMVCWYREVHLGLGTTGMGRPVFWGLFITDFVFFIGISHAGTLVSAILRISQAEWRRAITRTAEVITVLVLGFGAWSIMLDLGRVDRFLNLIFNGRLQSPLLWDVCSVTTYLTGSTIYLYLPLIPDIALLHDRVTGYRKPIYHLLRFGWRGTDAQRHALERAIGVMAVVILPVAVSVHTVISWIFAMTVRPMWHSTIFGPYFVAGAIFSGIGALLIAMAIIRKGLNLQSFIRKIHFNYLGMLLFVMAFLWLYFTTNEFLTGFYADEPAERAILLSKLTGRFAPAFWTMVVCCFVIPVTLLNRRKGRTVTACVISGLTVNVGMWLERYLIVVPTLERPEIGYPTSHYFPTFLEWSLLAGAFSGFILLYLLFARFFPIISIWEVREGREEAVQEVADRVRDYFPPEAPVHTGGGE